MTFAAPIFAMTLAGLSQGQSGGPAIGCGVINELGSIVAADTVTVSNVKPISLQVVLTSNGLGPLPILSLVAPGLSSSGTLRVSITDTSTGRQIDAATSRLDNVTRSGDNQYATVSVAIPV